MMDRFDLYNYGLYIYIYHIHPVIYINIQIQRGSVRKNTNNPVFNETFGFFVEMLTGAPKSDSIQVGIYHHDFNTKQDKSMGTFHLKVSELPEVNRLIIFVN